MILKILNKRTLESYKAKKAIKYWQNENHRKALTIFVSLKKGFTKDQRNILTQALHIINGHDIFYKFLGKDTQEIVKEANNLIENYIINYGLKR